MDKIWDRNSLEDGDYMLAVVAGMKKLNDHAEQTKVKRLKNKPKHMSETWYTHCSYHLVH